MPRTHLKNIPCRDTGKFLKAQEATTKVYPLRYSEEERRSDFGNLPYPEGLRLFSGITALLLVAVALGYNFLIVPCSAWKITRNAAWEYF